MRSSCVDRRERDEREHGQCEADEEEPERALPLLAMAAGAVIELGAVFGKVAGKDEEAGGGVRAQVRFLVGLGIKAGPRRR